MPNRKNIVGEQVRRIRNSLDLSQEQLAAKCQREGWDVSRATLSKVEAGLRLVTDAEVFFLAGVLGVTLSDLYGRKVDVKRALRQASPES